jgi:hypothetical protein
MVQYQVKRAGSIIMNIRPTGKQTKKIMNVNILDMAFVSPVEVDIRAEDTIEFEGETYTIIDQPNLNKVSSVRFEYSFQGKGSAYELGRADMFGLDGDNNLTEADFPVMGNADVIVDLIVQNANRAFSGWSKGTVDVTIAQNFTYSGENCLSALSGLASAYDIEWWVDGKTIHMTKKGEVQPVTFKYGQGNGLYNIKRTTSTDKPIVTRLYAYGSSDNIPGDYRSYSKRLKIPAPNLYIESNVAKYGIRELVMFFDDIKPEYKGAITSVVDNFNFIDTAIDFNVETQQLPNSKPQVTFLTGQLAGYTFEVGDWDNDTKQVRILKSESEKSIDLPSDLLHPQVGDTYSFLNINMPPVYITDAENRLLVKATDYLTKNNESQVVYGVTPSSIYFKQNATVINLGDYYHVKDTSFGLDSNIRVTGYTRDVQQLFIYTFDLQEIISIPQVVSNAHIYKGIKSAVSVNKLSDINRTRMNWKTTQQLRSMIYDPDGDYFDPQNIKPASIETLMLSVGAKAQQFILAGVLLQANYEGDQGQFAYSNGQLTQFTLFDTPHSWNFTGGLLTGLTDSQAYYIYAKCSKVDEDDATIILSNAPLATEAIAGYYVFWIGALHSVIDGVRGISLTYGQTTINGRFVTTGRVQSADGDTFFDLDEGIIGGKIQFGENGDVTIVDGNMVTTATIVLGDTSGQHAGITGQVVDDDSVLIWAGASFEDRDTATFQVTADGRMMATAGKIGNFTIDDKGLSNEDGTEAYIKQIHTFSDGHTAEMHIGLQDDVLGSGSALGIFLHDKVGDNRNAALVARATGALTDNNALEATGNIVHISGKISTEGHEGLSFIQVYKGASGDNYFVEFRNGLAIRQGEGTGT